jgi:hypothetical protein
VAAYRDRYGITTRTPLGPAPDGDVQKIDAARAKAALTRLRDLTGVDGSDDPSRTMQREGASRGPVTDCSSECRLCVVSW